MEKKWVILVISAVVSLVITGVVISTVNWLLAIMKIPSLPWFLFWGGWMVAFWLLIPFVKKELEKL